jgi:beta-N-acetylhexosaminidase
MRLTRFPYIFLLIFLAAIVVSARDYQQARPIQQTRDAEKWADKTLRKLSLEEKVGQMFMIRAEAEFMNAQAPDYLKLVDEIHRYHLGGLLLTVRAEGPFLYRNQPFEAASFTNRLQGESKVPLFFAADFERGLSMRFNGVSVFPHAMAFGAAGDPEYAAGFAQIVAQEARAIGVQWNFFPVADVNSNPDNPIINTRSFGEDPAEVSKFVAAYIEAARDNGLLTTAKHFPGHGDTSTDSHLGLTRVDGNQHHLETIELPPFHEAITAGVDAVMVAHVTAPALDPDPAHIASASLVIIQDLLRDKLGFKGIVVPDAMDMSAFAPLSNHRDSAAYGRYVVDAVKAGEDMVLLPSDLDAAYNAVLNAVRSSEISEAQINDSVRRILIAKAEVGLNKARFVDMDALPQIIATPAHVAYGQLIADSAVTLVRDNERVLPLHATAASPHPGTSAPKVAYQAIPAAGKQTVAVIFSDDVRTDSGRIFEQELRARIPDVNVMYVDPRIAAAMMPQVLAAVDQASTVVAAVYLIPTAGKEQLVNGVMQNTIDMAGGPAQLLHQMLARAADRTVVIALGTPYLASSFPEVLNYLCTFSNASVSEVSAVRALFGEIPIRGHLPVTIPGIAARGAGLQKPAVSPVQPVISGGPPSHGH